MLPWGILGALCVLIAIFVVRHWLMTKPQSISIKPKRRGLFRFSDGVCVREVDPIDVLAKMEAHPKFRHDLHPKRCELGEIEALEILADAVRSAFAVPAYTEPGKPGLTVRECFELYSVFAHYLHSQKKSTKPLQISPRVSDATSSESEPATTNDTLASGSIASV